MSTLEVHCCYMWMWCVACMWMMDVACMWMYVDAHVWTNP